MDPNIAKLKSAAAKYRTQRKHGRAAEAFAELADLDPKNPRWPHKLGEAHRSLGQKGEAVAAFEKAANAYLDKGFILKAIALCNMVISLAPDNERVQDTLTRLHAVPPEKRRPTTRDDQAAASTARPEQRGIPLSGQASSTEPAYGEDAFAPVAREIEFDESGNAREAIPGLVTSDAAEKKKEPELIIPPPPPPRQPTPAPRPDSEDTLDSIPIMEMIPDLVELAPDDEGASVYEIPLDEPTPVEEKLVDRLPPNALLSSLSRDELISFTSKVEVTDFDSGDLIIRQGDQGDTMFILVEGSVAVVREGEPRVTLSLLSEGAFFGEYALLTDLQRTATIEALEECTVLTISRKVMRDLVVEHPPVFKVLLRFFRDRMLGNLTHTHNLFRPFTREQRHALMGQFSFLEVSPGRTLVEQGREPDGLYLLVCGRAHVHRPGKLASPLETGEMFNKTALMSRTMSSHTVRTRSKSWLLWLSRKDFRELIMTHPHVLETLAEAGVTAAHQVQDLKPIEDREQTLPAV